MATLTVTPTASLSANGNTTATGSMNWAAPTMPNGVTSWDSIVITGSWSWGGKGNITNLTVDGQTVSNSFTVTTTKNPPITLTCVGGNKNASGAVTFSNLKVTYTYYVYWKLTTQQSTGGTISLNKSQAEPGDSITITATPATGYQLTELFVNGVSNGTSKTFSMPGQDTVVTATWSKVNYTISKSTCTGCSISLSKTSANYQDSIDVTVTLDIGYENAVVYVNGSSISGTTFSMPAQNTTVYAVAQKKRYTITITQPANGTVNVSNKNPQHGDTVTLTNTPNTGYELKTYIVNGSAISGSSFVVTDNTTVTAEFIQSLFTITKSSGIGCTFTISKTSANYGEIITVTPTLSTGYENPVLYVDNIAQTGMTFSMPNKNVTVDVRASKKKYKVTIEQPTVGGTVSVDNENPEYDTTIIVTATPATGYELDYITFNGSPQKDNQFVVNDNCTISAVFKKTIYNISVGNTVGCTISLLTNKATYGDTIRVEVTLLEGYENAVVSVLGTSYPVNGGTGVIFSMPASDITVDCTASKITCRVSVVNNPNGGTISATPTTAKYGDTITLSATPDIGYKLDYFTVDGIKIDGNSFVIKKDLTSVRGAFSKIDYAINIGACTGCSITVSKNPANYKDEISVTVVLNEGYGNTTIYVNGSAITGTTFSMPAQDITIYAVATPLTYTITIIQSDGGTVSVDKPTAKYGETVTITAIPDTWYTVGAYYVNDKVIVGNSFVITGNSVVTVRFFAGENTERLSIKLNGIWTPVSKVYRKQNGVWVLEEHPSIIFDENTNYVKGN